MDGSTSQGNFFVRSKELDQGQHLHQGSVRFKIRDRRKNNRDLVRRRCRRHSRSVPRFQFHFVRRGLLRVLLQADRSQDDSVLQEKSNQENETFHFNFGER